jgi:hypothetical protein
VGLLDQVPTSPAAGAPMLCTSMAFRVSPIAFAYAIRESVRTISFKEGAHFFHGRACIYK